MNKIEAYRATLRTLPDWDAYLLQESHLPGPRSNLELAQAVADEGDAALFERYIAIDAAQAPVNTPGEFLAVCGAIGLGRLLVEGRLEMFATLRRAGIGHALAHTRGRCHGPAAAGRRKHGPFTG